jgi:GDP-D-mannose 3',5'-epimerase
MKKALVCGGGGFIGSHLVKKQKDEGFWVRAVDLKFPEHWDTVANDFIKDDLRKIDVCREALDTQFDEVYQLAADMGGCRIHFHRRK